jgi:hypothetical protein
MSITVNVGSPTGWYWSRMAPVISRSRISTSAAGLPMI